MLSETNICNIFGIQEIYKCILLPLEKTLYNSKQDNKLYEMETI